MAFIPTQLQQAVGQSPTGKPAPNKPEDVRKVQALLKKVLGPALTPMQNGVCDAATRGAIVDFQQRWRGTADGVVDPQGRTLERLDRLATPLELKPISLARVTEAWKDGKCVNDGGGYQISVRTCDGGALPPNGSGWVLYLSLMDDQHCVDVTGRPLSDLMCQANLGELLTLIDSASWWGVPLPCRAQLRLRGQVISSSVPQVLNAPVQPHNGVLLPLDEAGNGAKLSYQGNADAGDFHGRMLAKVPGFAKYVFVYGGRLELQAGFRGFDCITYAGTACGASTSHMADAADLAESLGALPCTVNISQKQPTTGQTSTEVVSLEKADPAHVKAYFNDPSNSGYHLMWSAGHVVIVAAHEVHEFKASAPSGYTRTAVATWLAPYQTKKLTVRRLPARPALAA